MMNKLMGAAMLAGATVAGVGAANAEVSGSVSMTTDYVFRGISQTDNGPAIQGSFDWSQDMFYAGAWASNVDDFGADASMELDLYAGLTGEAGQFSWDASVVGYFYPGAADDGAEFDYFEGIAKGSFALTEQASFGATIAYSPEYFGDSGDGLWMAVNGAYAFSDALSVSGEFGNQDVDLTGDYDTWNIGGSYAMHGFTLDLRYHDTNIDGLDEIVNLSISREL
jgi:uncharacterized protein (TIGR02001 family)